LNKEAPPKDEETGTREMVEEMELCDEEWTPEGCILEWEDDDGQSLNI
jgi:hypothetical protein